MELHFTATACHSVTMLPDTSENTALTPAIQADLPTLEGWKAEWTQVIGYLPRWFTHPLMVTNSSTSPAQHRAGS